MSSLPLSGGDLAAWHHAEQRVQVDALIYGVKNDDET